jgi:serine phosphatase RsbU (regulator of sigma subunit)
VSDSQQPIAPRAQLERYLWAAFAVWTGVVVLSLVWNLVQVSKDTLELARIQARVAYDKDVLYRRWNAGQSPVYVAATDQTPPNPYLSDLPERDVTTPAGTRLTVMNPAYMTRQVHEIAEVEQGVRGHITSLTPIRRENIADPWETEALKTFPGGQTEVSSVETLDGRSYMRLMRPLVTEQGCMKCHAKQGYEVGDIRGGISNSIPMEPLWAVGRRYKATISLGHGLVWLLGVAGILLGGQRLRASRDLIEVKNSQLTERSQQLQETYDQLEREFEAVRDVQIGLLPASAPEIPGFEGATHYRPATRAGGDYFDFFRLPENQWGVLVADVSGHGAPAAVVMAMAHAILHTTSQKVPAEHIVRYLNDALSRIIESGQFVTCCYGVLDPGTRRFTFASAGHNPPLHYDVSSRRVHVCDSEGGLPLGIAEGMEYSASCVEMKPGGVLLLYTDGITEACNEQDEEFGLTRLTTIVEKEGPHGPAQVRDGILAALDEHRGSVELADDTTLVVLRVV